MFRGNQDGETSRKKQKAAHRQAADGLMIAN